VSQAHHRADSVIGVQGFVPCLGLPDVPYLHELALDAALGYTEPRPGARIPIAAFCRIMGVAPAEHPPHAPPRATGGSVGIRHLVGGSTVSCPSRCPEGARVETATRSRATR
jgi:acetamidase/formamidase